jgi:hypothetical protein
VPTAWSNSVRPFLFGLGLLACLALLACEAEGPATAGIAAVAPRPGQALSIDSLSLPSLHFTAGEGFEIHFRVLTPGSGNLRAYGLATRLGTQTYPFEGPMPVVAGGRVLLGFAGPLPKQNEAGRFDLEFWVVDSVGTESNRLKGQVTVQ